MRRAIKRALARNLLLDTEAEYNDLADAIIAEVAQSSEGLATLRSAIGNCPFRFVALFAAHNGREWSSLLNVAYQSAGGRLDECSCYYCLKGRHE